MTTPTSSIDGSPTGRRGWLDGPWLFSRKLDLLAFGGSAAASLIALAVGGALGLLERDSPEWTWISAILLVDVAHVWATGFRVYFDRDELLRRPALYFGTPAFAFAAGLLLYQCGSLVFWRTLAYLAVFHFVRQQAGWVALYRRRAGETGGKFVDLAAIYLATVWPLVWWHAHLPRRFSWFLPGDFFGGSVAEAVAVVEPVVRGVYIASLATYVARAVRQARAGRPNAGKHLVLATTAVCWWVGIVVFDSDYAFTVTNVLIHGVPYLVLVYLWTAKRRESGDVVGLLSGPRSGWRLVVFFLATCWLLAYGEELLWDRSTWNERPWLFGEAFPGEAGAGLAALWVPLLATPQLTHYLLDGFLWRSRGNPKVLGGPPARAERPEQPGTGGR